MGGRRRKNMLVLPDIMLWASIWHFKPNFFPFKGVHGLLHHMTREPDHSILRTDSNAL